MAKRRNQTQNDVSIVLKKNKRNVNNNEHEEAEAETNSEAENCSTPSSQLLYTRCGKILAVKLRNFMCHENLNVQFNAEANLLIGKNGSGKSAVLTALIIGLGCKANATNRSNNIKQLIRTGESSATIEIHLSNDGFDSYESDRFGDKIIVVRQINSSGASTYKLKNIHGDVVSTKRADLLKMVLYINIQVDNPVCVLTQDAARGFLRDSNPKKRFELFMKATQMDVIIDKLHGCSEQLKTSRGRLNVQKDMSVELEKKFQEAKLQIDKIKSLNPMKEEIERYRCEKKWISVVSQESMLADIKKMLDDAEQKKAVLIRDTENGANNVNKLQSQFAELNANIDALVQSCNENRRKHDTGRTLFKQSNERMAEHSREVKKLESKKERVEREICKMNERIENHDDNDVAQLKEENRRQMEMYKDRQKEVETITEGTRRDIRMISHNNTQLSEKIADLQSQNKQNSEDIVRTNQQYQNLNRSTPLDILRLYGDHMPSVVKDIKRLFEAGKFSKMPIGPIGPMIEVIDPKYLKYIEDLSNKMLHTIIVNNAKDLTELKNLFRTKYAQVRPPPMITMKFRDQLYDVRGKRVAPDSRYVVMMDAVKIENPNVMNCLIDFAKADSVVFVDEWEVATHLTSKRENVPPNLSRVVLLKPYSEYYPAPSYRTYSRNVNSARYLRVTSSLSEKYFKCELEKLRANKLAIETDLRQWQIKLKESLQRLNERNQDLTQLDNESSSLRRNIIELESFEYPEDTEVAVMSREIIAQNAILADIVNQLSVAGEKTRQLEIEVADMDNKVKQIRNNMQLVNQQIVVKQNEADKVKEEVEKCSSTAGFAERQIPSCNAAITKLTSEMNAANEKLQKLIATAEKAGKRIENCRSEEELNDLIKSKEKRINVINSSNCTMEQAKAIFEQCKKEFDENESLVKKLAIVVTKFHASTVVRFRTIKALKHCMMARVQYSFQRLMELRGFEGSLDFDMDNRTLDLKVIPRDKNITTVGGGVSSLSGGERSYVTVALLMSLWKCVDHPFFFLDEYDVFTDHVNRKYLTDILLNQASTHPDCQYTFLTPQDITGVVPSERLAIQRLNEPNR